jgi:hypothetical protein
MDRAKSSIPKPAQRRENNAAYVPWSAVAAGTRASLTQVLDPRHQRKALFPVPTEYGQDRYPKLPGLALR